MLVFYIIIIILGKSIRINYSQISRYILVKYDFTSHLFFGAIANWLIVDIIIALIYNIKKKFQN